MVDLFRREKEQYLGKLGFEGAEVALWRMIVTFLKLYLGKRCWNTG